MRISLAMVNPQKRILALIAIFVLQALIGGIRPANADRNPVDDLFTALRDRKFSDATAHFDPTMKKELSADQLSSVWLQIVATEGQLDQWKVINQGMLGETNVYSVVLAFEHGKVIATVSVRPHTGEIAGLYLKTMTTETKAS